MEQRIRKRFAKVRKEIHHLLSRNEIVNMNGWNSPRTKREIAETKL